MSESNSNKKYDATSKQTVKRLPKINVLERTIAIPKYFRADIKDAECQADGDNYESQEEVEYETRKILPIIQERFIPIKKTVVEHSEVFVEPDDYAQLIMPLFGKNGLIHLPDENLHPDDADYFADLQPTLAGWRQKFHHRPLPVELSITSYTPSLIPRLVDRAVPIPVEMEVVIEYEIPIIKPRWVEKPIPIPVKANIELPIPLDVLLDKNLHEPYMDVMTKAFVNRDVKDLMSTGIVDRATAEKMIHLSTLQNKRYPHVERVDLQEAITNEFGPDRNIQQVWGQQDSRALDPIKGLNIKEGKLYLGTDSSIE